VDLHQHSQDGLPAHASVPAVTDVLAGDGGVALMAAGMVAVGYAVYLEMIHAVPLHWWDRSIVLAPAGLIAILGGLLLST
jgi:hypothetical protein